MGRLCNQKQLLFFVVLLTITSLHLWTANGDEGAKTAADEPKQAEPAKASLGQRLMSMATEMHKSSQGPIGKFKSLVYSVQEKFFPPSVDFKSKETTPEAGVGSTMKDAVQKSFQASEATIEDTAETASKVMGDTAQKTKETAQKTKEKVKEKVKGDESPKTKKKGKAKGGANDEL